MGEMGYEPVVQHFSHPHPLEISNLQQQPAAAAAVCAGCKLRPSGCAYTCRACSSFHLHITCAQMPRRIQHPVDGSHPLTLSPVPVYPGGSFHCDACGNPGTGFSYGCGDCGLDFHTLCASLPLSVAHYSHPHPLALAFSGPYGDGGFSCDVCGGVGRNQWLYRCASCEFDAHTGCAAARQPSQTDQRPMVQQGSRAVPANQPGAAPVMVSRAGSSNRKKGGGGLLGRAIKSFVDGAAQQAGQSIVQAVVSGGGGGGGGDDCQGGDSYPVPDEESLATTAATSEGGY